MGHIAWFMFIAGGSFVMGLDIFINESKFKGSLFLLLSLISMVWAFIGN